MTLFEEIKIADEIRKKRELEQRISRGGNWPRTGCQRAAAIAAAGVISRTRTWARMDTPRNSGKPWDFIGPHSLKKAKSSKSLNGLLAKACNGTSSFRWREARELFIDDSLTKFERKGNWSKGLQRRGPRTGCQRAAAIAAAGTAGQWETLRFYRAALFEESKIEQVAKWQKPAMERVPFDRIACAVRDGCQKSQRWIFLFFLNWFQ